MRRTHSKTAAVLVGLAAILSLFVAAGCSEDSPTAPPQNPPVTSVQDGPGNYFVNVAAGDDANAGTKAAPFKTVQRAIDVAAGANARAEVYVAYGTYPGSITLRSRMSIHGGYSPSTWTRDLAADSTVIDGGPTAVRASEGSGADSLAIDGFTIRSQEAFILSGSSIGIHLRSGSQGVVITDNRIVAGNGRFGSLGNLGSNGLSPGGAGGAGANGGGCPNDGGTGQASTSGYRGGNGGHGVMFLGDAGDGSAGAGPGGGSGGDGGNLFGTAFGIRGTDGDDGADGANGAGGAGFGSVVGGAYSTANGAKGTNGLNGGGGGGGGGGRGPSFECGPGGGGGGAGGGGAEGGGGGSGGGASIGILMAEGSTGVLENNVIVTGTGGQGGNGRGGASGGLGGGSGSRGSIFTDFLGDTSSSAGVGGSGGNGGDGGPGGGGGGGPTIAILEDAASSSTRIANQITVGAGGNGGNGVGGTNGAGGEAAEYKKL